MTNLWVPELDFSTKEYTGAEIRFLEKCYFCVSASQTRIPLLSQSSIYNSWLNTKSYLSTCGWTMGQRHTRWQPCMRIWQVRLESCVTQRMPLFTAHQQPIKLRGGSERTTRNFFKIQLEGLLRGKEYDPENQSHRQFLAYVFIPVVQRGCDVLVNIRTEFVNRKTFCYLREYRTIYLSFHRIMVEWKRATHWQLVSWKTLL